MNVQFFIKFASQYFVKIKLFTQQIHNSVYRQSSPSILLFDDRRIYDTRTAIFSFVGEHIN